MTAVVRNIVCGVKIVMNPNNSVDAKRRWQQRRGANNSCRKTASKPTACASAGAARRDGEDVGPAGLEGRDTAGSKCVP